MSEVILRPLSEADEAAFFEGLKTLEDEDLSWYTFTWNPELSYAQVLERLRKDYLGVDLQPGRVAASMLYGFVDAQIVGRVSIRHSLNDFLLQRGGHLGYWVAPRFRRRGYAMQMFRQGLDYCRQTLGMSRLLITCEDSNTPSIRMIEAVAARLENKVEDPDKAVLVRRYWLEL